MVTPSETPADNSHSVSALIERLKDSDPQAVEEVWQRFFSRLLPLARAKLRTIPDRSVDEEDVLVSVFDRFFRAVGEQRFARLNDRDDLWQLLLMLVDRKLITQYRRSQAVKRGEGQVISLDEVVDAGSGPINELADPSADPQYIATFNERMAQAISRLEPGSVRETAVLKLEGYENKEIAQRLGIGLSSVERKLRVIRETWESSFAESQ